MLKNLWDDPPGDFFHVLLVGLAILAQQDFFLIKNTPDHDRDGHAGDEEGCDGVEEQGKAEPHDEKGRVVRMSDVLEDATGDELTLVGAMPEQLPLEVHEATKKENHHAQYDAEQLWDGELPDAGERGEWSDENNQQQRGVVDDEERPQFLWWSVPEHSG